MPPSADHAISRLFLIRHGDTDWTDLQRHTGRTDIPLNAVGEARAKLLKERLSVETFSAVFTSPLRRARFTCELSGFADRAIVDDALVEWDYGDYERLTSAEIRRGRPDWNLFRDGVPNGESPADVAARADAFLQTVLPIAGDVAAFSSGHTIRMIAARWLGYAPSEAHIFFTSTASIGVLGYEHGNPVIRLWNDARS